MSVDEFLEKNGLAAVKSIDEGTVKIFRDKTHLFTLEGNELSIHRTSEEIIGCIKDKLKNYELETL